MSKKKTWRPGFAWLALPCACFLLSLASLYLANVTGVLNSGRQDVCFSVDASASGIMQLFRSTIAGGYTEQQSESRPLIQGIQAVCFPVSVGERFLRWDPNNIASSMQINRASVSFYGFRQSLALDPLESNSHAIINSASNKHALKLSFTNDDPQIIFEISDSIRNKEILYGALLLTLALTFTLYIARQLFKKIIIEKNPAYRMAAFAIIALILIHQFTGIIAVGNGTGWDGNAYLDLLFTWKHSGHLPDTDPYRISRLASVFPTVASEFLFDLSRRQLLYVQMAFNILGIGIALGLFLDYLLKSGLPLKPATQYTLVLLLTWPVLVLSTYYPMLSDHLAVVLSCFCLWCFAHKRFSWLVITCLLSPLVMPGLFLLPLTLLTFSSLEQESSRINQFVFTRKSRLLVFVGLAVAMIIYACLWFTRISDEELLHVGSTLAPGLPRARLLSSAYLIGSLVLIAWLWSRLLEKNGALSVLSVSRFFLALSAATLGHAILYFGLDWNKGFKGPNLLQNMFYQGLNAPFKPLLSHFVYFGPCFIIALQLLFLSTPSARHLRSVKIAILGFLPLLAIGSESRQWVAILPFLVAYIAQFDFSEKRRQLMLYCSVLLLIPLFWLATAVTKANSMQLPTTDPLWQLYFGRYGPWMSQTTFLISTMALLVFIVAWVLTRPSRTKTKAEIY